MHRAGVGCTALAGGTGQTGGRTGVHEVWCNPQGECDKAGSRLCTYVRKGISFRSLVVGLERALPGGFRV